MRSTRLDPVPPTLRPSIHNSAPSPAVSANSAWPCLGDTHFGGEIDAEASGPQFGLGDLVNQCLQDGSIDEGVGGLQRLSSQAASIGHCSPTSLGVGVDGLRDAPASGHAAIVSRHRSRPVSEPAEEGHEVELFLLIQGSRRPPGIRDSVPCSRLAMSVLGMACSVPAALRSTTSSGVPSPGAGELGAVPLSGDEGCGSLP